MIVSTHGLLQYLDMYISDTGLQIKPNQSTPALEVAIGQLQFVCDFDVKCMTDVKEKTPNNVTHGPKGTVSAVVISDQ